MAMPKEDQTIDGFDPLTSVIESDLSMQNMLDNASRRVVLNILKSYTGYFDVFSEIIQNSLDALERRSNIEKNNYKPKLHIEIDIQKSKIRMIDNGIGMSGDEFRFCLRPSVSFKNQSEGRGHKGVGATFLAYGFSFFRLETRQNGKEIAAIIRQGRQWAEDNQGTIPRPKFEQVEFSVPELEGETSGTCVEIRLGQTPGERPKNMAWLGAQAAEQWFDILRIKTPLGGVYLDTPAYKPTVTISVINNEGNKTTKSSSEASYYFPHEMPSIKVASLRDIEGALDKIAGDSQTKFGKISSEFKRLDCIYEIWDYEQILDDASPFDTALNEELEILINQHKVIVYIAFLRSAKMWTEFNEDVLKIRKGMRLIHGGMQLATDFMVQGDLAVIPLTSAIGYQANAHVIVHFTDGNPDMGRKTFQPELTNLAEILSVRAVNRIRRFLSHLKPDTGAQVITPDKDLYDWKRKQENYRDEKPLSLIFRGNEICVISQPQQEQDVISLYHELVGIRLLRGYRFYATSQSDRYDCLFHYEYDSKEFLFDKENNSLGVTHKLNIPQTSEPKILEYKYDFDSLISDFDKEIKYEKHIDLVVCWTLSNQYKEKYFMNSLLVGDEGSNRQFFGATHQAYTTGSEQATFEVMVLQDLINFMHSPKEEQARQKAKYSDD